MIGKDKILKSAKAVEQQINVLREAILEMCDDLDAQESIEQKEIIRLAIVKSIKDLNILGQEHFDLINQL